MRVYFSHSYRDVVLNSYFLEHFSTEDIPLEADQKTSIWCVAKLERYLGETTGFVSIIPRRPTEDDEGAYSPYIGQELNLARRARVPRLIFVDELVLKRHQLHFPADAVPFSQNKFLEESGRHREAISTFRQKLEMAYRPPHEARAKEAAVIAGSAKHLVSAAQDVAEILRRQGFSVTSLFGSRRRPGLDDIDLLERLWRSELCVFILGENISEAHIALAMAHAHCIPSVRLQYDGAVSDCSPSLSGVIRWKVLDQMLMEFNQQLMSYMSGLVQPVEIARASNATVAARTIGTMKDWARKENLWDLRNSVALVDHVLPGQAFVKDQVNRVRQLLGKSLGSKRDRQFSMEVCRNLYDGIRRFRFGYEVEPQSGVPGKQAIRSPSQIETHRTATCIDLACLFASLLEEAVQNPVIVVLEGKDFAHALAGYRAKDEPPLPTVSLGKPDEQPAVSLGELRRVVTAGDVVLFEGTGAVEADSPVGAEGGDERIDKMLDFMAAKEAAKRMVLTADVRLRHFIDVSVLRQEIQKQ